MDLFDERGLAYERKGEYDRAVADYTNAIKLADDYRAPSGYIARARALLGSEDYEGASADLARAAKLIADDSHRDYAKGELLRVRGRLRFFLGEYGSAQQDILAALGTDFGVVRDEAADSISDFLASPGNAARSSVPTSHLTPERAYERLWAAVAATRAHGVASSGLGVFDKDDNAKDLARFWLARRSPGNAKDWPFPLIGLYLGGSSPEAALTSGETDEQRCEAQFFVGEWYLVKQRTDLATKMLQNTERTCPRTSDGYRGARAELKRIAPHSELIEQYSKSAQPNPAQDQAAQVWAVTKDTTSKAILEDFIRQFGDTPYGSMARARLDELKKSQTAAVHPPVLSPAPPQRSERVWDHDGSKMQLFADQAVRKFIYENPRAGLASAGIKKGTVLFNGRREGNSYSGTAYFFSHCGVKPYRVTGPVSEDQRKVTLSGRAPIFDANCHGAALTTFVASHFGRYWHVTT